MHLVESMTPQCIVAGWSSPSGRRILPHTQVSARVRSSGTPLGMEQMRWSLQDSSRPPHRAAEQWYWGRSSQHHRLGTPPSDQPPPNMSRWNTGSDSRRQ